MEDVRSPAIGFLEDAEEPFRVVGLSGQTHTPNVGTLTGIDDVRFSSPVHPLRFHEWYRAAEPVRDDAFPTISTFRDARSPLLRSFNVRYVLRSTVPGHDIQTFLPRVGDRPSRGYAIDPPPGEGFRLVLDAGSVEIHEARDFHPRVHFANEVIVVDGGMAEAIRKLGELPEGSRAEVVESTRAESLLAVEPVAAEDEVRLTYPSMRRVSIAIRAAGPRLLVLHDSWDRGWSAKLDGEPVEILPTSVLSRGVVVPAGEHRIEMSFVPWGSGIGAVLSLLAISTFPLLASRLRGRMGAS
jgi:hypothetical protein